MVIPERMAQLRALAGSERQRQRAEQRRHRRHHDRAEAQQTGLRDRLRADRARRARACSAKSIIMIAFFLTMPISRMMPMNAMIVNSVSNSSSAISAPTLAEGSVEMIVSGWM